MAIMMKRQLNDSEKQTILQRYGKVCYANGHAIPDGEKIHFDHIKAYTSGGPTDLSNIAPMCERHNLDKGALPLEDFRTKLRIQEFFKKGPRLTLKDLLQYFKEIKEIETYGEKVALDVDETKNIVKVENASFSKTYIYQTCPLTGWKYFYCTLPIDILDSDDDHDEHIGLQPRFLIFDKVFEMFRHFQFFPVLQPSIGRFHKGKILLFDGQHKAASLLWTGRHVFECKIYIAPDIVILNQANISAHDKFAQTRFFSSVMVLKLGNQFGKDFDEYRDDDNFSSKTEVSFLEYLLNKPMPITRGEVNTKFRSYLYNSILKDETNKWLPLVSEGNRSSKEQPITLDMLSKSIFANFLCTSPLKDDILSNDYKRDVEATNVIRLMNILYDKGLFSWNPKASPNDNDQLKLNRIFASKSIMAWSERLRDAILVRLAIRDHDDYPKMFYREIADEKFSEIEDIVQRLYDWPQWSSPKNTDIDAFIARNKSSLKDWFKEKGLSVSYLLGVPD
jgi:hypothetical protein